MSLALLRRQLDEILAPALSEPGLPTGLAELDAALPGGGLPRGRLSELVGTRGSGKTTLTRRVVEAVAGRGLWVAYVDAARTLAPRDWAHLGEREGVWMIRPREVARGAWCADVLLRSGAFGLVVLDGVPPLARQVAVRLTRLARDGGAALLVVGDEDGGGGAMVGGAVRLRVRRGPRQGVGHAPRTTHHAQRARRFAVTVEKGGTFQTVEVSCAIGVARRLCTHSEVPDRRGVAPRGAAGRTDGAAAAVTPAGGAAARKRRCAEPALGRDDPVPRALRAAVARARALG